MKRVLLCLILTSSLWPLHANEDLERIVTLAEDTRDVVVELEDVPEDFHLDRETSDFVFSLQEMDKEIAAIVPESLVDPTVSTRSPATPLSDDPCGDEYSIDSALAERIQGRKFKLYFTATFSEGAELGLNPGFAGKNNFRNFMVAESQSGHPNAYQIRSLQGLENRYLNSEKPENWDELSLVEKAEALQEFAREYSGAEPSLGLILSEYAIADMTANPNNWRTSLNEIKDHLTFDEKLKVASHFGGRFSDNYNYDRADGEGPRGSGIVTIEEMLESVRDSTPGGVCRDVSQAQSLMLQEMGVDSSDIYQVSYRTASSGHVVLAVKDPDNPKRIVKINYDYTDETDDRSGGAALSQNSSLQEFGHQYRIYDAAGKPVATVPTEMGQVLRDVTQGRGIENGLTRNHNLQRVYVDTPYGVGSLFRGTTTSGDNLVGVAITKNVREEATRSEFDYGVALVKRDGERATVNVSETALYGYMKMIYNTPRIERGNFSIGARGGIENEMIIGQNRVDYDDGRVREGVNFDARIGPFVGADINYESDDARTRVNTGVELESFINHRFEQEGPESGFMLVPDQLTWSTTVEREVSDHMTLTGESAVVLTNIGNSAVFKGGLYNERWDLGGAFSYQTPLSDDVPAFNLLSSEAVGLEINKSFESPNRRINGGFSLEYLRDLDLDQNQLNANFGIKW